ncbi:DUF6069 family protein [Tellurirhabdus rosea]|uniref:DUF6069 family protein n=1 Tax=Tellurirhabdus rosea TaxID=2674997 RepID=UPI0022504AD9|nr:DUF6069 family protein [Tellurirhabdus rosea]
MATLTTSIPLSRVLAAAAKAGLIAFVVNTVIYYVAYSQGWWQFVPTPDGRTLDLQKVVTMSVLPALVAGLVFFALLRIARQPVRVFYVIAALVFVAMFFGPFSLSGIRTGMIMLLQLMHLVVTALVVRFLVRTVQ